jgi:hypothetical protein
VEFSVVIFTSFLLAAGLVLILRVREALRGDPPPADRRDLQWNAYEERRMRLRRDRVWQRMDALYAEFAERQAAGRLPGANAPTHRAGQGGGSSKRAAHGEASAATAQSVASRHERRADDPPPAI